MPQTSPRGLLLAACGALILTPDALLMRLSGMDGLQMLSWRGLCTGLVFWAIWLMTTQDRSSLRHLASPAGLILVAAHSSNVLLFPSASPARRLPSC